MRSFSRKLFILKSFNCNLWISFCAWLKVNSLLFIAEKTSDKWYFSGRIFNESWISNKENRSKIFLFFVYFFRNLIKNICSWNYESFLFKLFFNCFASKHLIKYLRMKWNLHKNMYLNLTLLNKSLFFFEAFSFASKNLQSSKILLKSLSKYRERFVWAVQKCN